MWESLARVNAVVGGVVWGPVGLALLFGTGCLLTVRTGFFQLRYFGYWMRHTIGAIFLDRNVTAHTDDEAISQFQSLCTALAATIGTGNIVGVAAAILAGGPGAVFWMWAMALLGMMTSYAENVLGICYRRRDAAGRWCGGPMYYLAEGLGGGFGRVLAVLFACFCVLASFGMGNMSQINSIAGNLQAVFRVPPVATGIVLALLTGRVILGGLKRVAAVTEAIVPLMALFYLFGALTVVCVHWAAVPAAFAAIFRGAFGPQFIAVSVLLFAYSTTLGWSHYGTRAVVYLLGERAAAGYKLVFAAMVLVGAVMKLDLAWALSDTFNGLMMLPNLVGVVGLSGVVVRETQAYLKRK